MGLLASLTTYNKGWEEVSREMLSEDADFKEIESASVIEKEQNWGTSTSICLFMKGGGKKYLPLSRDSELEDGDNVDLESIEIIELERDGETIYRADGEKATSKARDKKK